MTYYITRKDGAKVETLDKTGVEAVVADGSDNERVISSIEEVNAHRDYEAWLGDGAQYEDEDKREGVLYMIADSSIYEELEAKVDALEEQKDEALGKVPEELDAYVAGLDQKVIQFRDTRCTDPVDNGMVTFGPVASYKSRSWTKQNSYKTTWNGQIAEIRLYPSFRKLPTKYHNMVRIRWSISGEAFDPFSNSGVMEVTMDEEWYERNFSILVGQVTVTGPMSGSGNYQMSVNTSYTIEGQF